MHISRVRPGAEPTNISQVACTGEQCYGPAVEKTGSCNNEIVEVTCPHPGIVSNKSVALVHGLNRKMIKKMFYRFRHRIDVAWRPSHRLGIHPSVEPKNASGKITAFPHNRAERSMHKGLSLFLDDGDQPVPHDLQTDGVQTGHFHHSLSPFRSKTIYPFPAMQAPKPGGT